MSINKLISISKYWGLKLSFLTVIINLFLSFSLAAQSSAPKIISPGAGDKIESGRLYKIEWDNVRGPTVNISLIGRDYRNMIVRDAPNNGSFLWEVNCSLYGDYSIWVMSSTSNSRIRSNTFSIINPRKIMAPKPGATIKSGDKYIIKWAGFDCKKVRITLGGDSIGTHHISLSTANTGSFLWQVPKNYKGNNFKLYIRDVNNQNCMAMSDNLKFNPFSVSSTKNLITRPVVRSGQNKEIHQPTKELNTGKAKLLLYPKGGETLKSGNSYIIRWTGLSGGPNIRIILIENDKFEANIALDEKNNGSFNWKVSPSREGTKFQIRITGYPNNRNDYLISQPFTIIKPPEVIKPSRDYTLHPGKKFMINWRNYKSRTLIIELLQGGIVKEVITKTAPNNKNYEWRVPASLMGSGFQIRIKSLSEPEESAVSESFVIIP